MNSNYKKILSSVTPENFVCRIAETDALRRHAAGANTSPGLLVLSAPAVGASELLKQTYDRLFFEQSETIPVYFAISDSDKTAKDCAIRFLHTFITQAVAFRRQDAQIIDAALGIGELAELVAADDGDWIDRLITTYQTESQFGNDRAFVRHCLSASLRAAASGANSLVMIDHLHETDFFSGEINFIEKIKEVFTHSSVPFVLAGRRRFLLKAVLTGNAKLTGTKTLPVESLAFTDAGVLAENVAAKYAVEINEPTRDLIAVKFQGNPTFTEFLMQAASEKKISLDSFRRVEQIYADEVFGGKIGKFYDAVLEKITPDIKTQKTIVELFHNALTTENEKTSVENWTKNFNLTFQDSRRLTSLLNTHEIIGLSSNQIKVTAENEVLSDYLTARFRLESAAENRAAVVGQMLSRFLKRAPQTMAKFYRRNAAIGLRELLALFNRQETPISLLDYAVYQERLEESETLEDLTGEPEKIALPQIIYTAHTAAFYPPFEQLAEKARAAVALGFVEKKIETDADETVWLAAEIDSKLEASAEMTEFWCDRLEMVALNCNFPTYVIWLVAPEGFASDALEILKQRNGYGSSRRQVELLTKFLQGGASIVEKTPTAEYEIVVPMGDNGELISAAAIEEIARRHHYAPKAINQMKTAMVEACINAAEHSLSPERKIYQKFAVEADKIVITISNRGLRLADKKAEEITPNGGRRGWGLKLIKTLMDEVKFEQVDDGTRISMTKYLNQ